MKHELCSAIKADGNPCRSLVSPGKHRCHYHWDFDLRERRRNRALMRPHSPTIRLGPLADRHAILRALNRVFRPLDERLAAFGSRQQTPRSHPCRLRQPSPLSAAGTLRNSTAPIR